MTTQHFPEGSSAPAPPPGTPEPVDPRRSVAGRVLLVVGLVAVSLAVVWAAVWALDRAVATTGSFDETYDAAERLELVASSRVTVHADPDAQSVEVHVVQRGGFTGPEYSAEQVGDELVVSNRCRWWTWWPNTCRAELHVVAPAQTAVTVRTTNGAVQASGFAGDVDLRTTNGAVEAHSISGTLVTRSTNGRLTVRDVVGGVDLHTTNGRIEAHRVDGSVRARTTNGAIEVAAVSGSVDARTTNRGIDVEAVAGDVTAQTTNGAVRVVGDGEPVALTISTTNGRQVVEGPTDPAAARSVEIRSTNGDVSFLSP